jgi:hypothetical protein
VAAHRRLWKLQDVTGLGDAKLVALEKAEKPEPGRVGEDLHPGEQRVGLSGGGSHL